MYISGVAQIAKGNIGVKAKAGSLWAAKEGLYWWCIRFIETFSTMYQKWHTQLVAHIHLVAISEGKTVATRSHA